MKALGGLLRKEVYHILRDRRTLVVLLMLPVVQVVLFGYTIRTDLEDVRIAIVDPTPDATTLALRARFSATNTFHVIGVFASDSALAPLFRRGDAQIALVFSPRFGETLARGDAARLLVVTDASEPNTSAGRLAYVNAVIQRYELDVKPMRDIQIVPRIRSRFNPTRESANLFVPGLMALVLTIISALMTALSLTREKETGTMEALLVSPLRPREIIIGKVAPYVAIGLVSVVAVLIEARLFFHIPIRGSALLLIGEGVLFILVALALGMLISARTSSQRVAMLATMLATMLPTIMLSGFIFPVESMPRALQLLSVVVPARWFVLIARGIMLKGVGLHYLWRETLILAAMAVVLLAAGVRSFKTRLA